MWSMNTKTLLMYIESMFTTICTPEEWDRVIGIHWQQADDDDDELRVGFRKKMSLCDG